MKIINHALVCGLVGVCALVAMLDSAAGNTNESVTSSPATPKSSADANPKDIYGLYLGMDYDAAVAILENRIPGLTSDMSSAGQTNSGVLTTTTRSCVSIELLKSKCVESFSVQRKLDGQVHMISALLVEDWENRPGISVIYRVGFTHSFDPKHDAVDPVSLAIRKYGPPDHEGTDGSRRVAGYSWDVTSSMGDGEVLLHPKFSSTRFSLNKVGVRCAFSGGQGEGCYGISLSVDEAIYRKLLAQTEEAFASARSNQDAAF